MEKLTIEQFGSTIKQKYPQYGHLSDEEVGRKTIAKYPQYQEKVEFNYDVAPLAKPIETPQQKIARYNQEQVAYDQKAKEEGSLTGMAKNFGKAFVGTVANSEVGLGKSLQKIFGNQSKTYNEAIQTTANTQANLVKEINKRKAAGQDTTKLQQLYNEGLKTTANLKKGLAEESKLPTEGEVVGQIGGTALDLLTAGTYGKAKAGMQSEGVSTLASSVGLPELSQIARQKASGIFTGKGALNVVKGAGIGYGYDVTQGLQGARGEERTGGAAFVPGLGTVIGGGIPAISETVQSVKNRLNPVIQTQNLVDKRAKELSKLDSYQTLKKASEKGRERGIDVKKVLADTDVLQGSVDNTGTITTKGEGGAVQQYTDQFIKGNENIVSEALKKEARSVSPDYVKARLVQEVKNAGIEGKALTQALKSIDDEIAGYALRAGDNGVIPLETLHKAKINKYDNINFFTEGNAKQYDKTVAKALKKIVEENTTSLDVKKVNEELSKHFAVIDYLNKLDGKKVEGGKLGKYFAQTVGAVVGSHFGPLGAIAGAEAGGAIKGGAMSRAFGGKTGKIPEEAAIFKQAKEYLGSKPLELSQSKSNNLGSLNNNQSSTIAPTMINGISNKLPQTLETSRKLSTVNILPKEKGLLGTAIENLKNPSKRQGGYIANPLAKKELPVSKSSSVNNTLSNDLIEASVASKLPPKTIPKSKPNFTPELKKNIAEIIDAQRGISKVSPEKMIELEADMTSIIEDFGFSIPKTKSAQITLLEKIFNGKI